MEQNSLEWLRWRHKGIGGSDANIIMRVSRFSTPFKLWQDKILDEPHIQAENYIQRRGHEIESKVLGIYAFESGLDFKPALFQSSEVDFMRCSVDGVTESGEDIIEIKLLGREKFNALKNGIIPKDYYPQTQHNLAVSGAKRLHFVGYHEESDTDLAFVTIGLDQNYLQKLIEEEVKFWNLVKTKTPPEMSDEDYLNVTDDRILKLKEIDQEMKRLKSESDEIRKDLEASATHPRIRFQDGSTLASSIRRGNVNAEKLAKASGLNPDDFRGEDKTVWTLRLSK